MKTITKRTICTLLSVVMILSVFTVSATEGQVKYKVEVVVEPSIESGYIQYLDDLVMWSWRLNSDGGTRTQLLDARTGEFITSIKKDYRIGDFKDGLALVQKDQDGFRKFGFINTKGEEVIPIKYDNAHDFYDGLAAVKIGGWEFNDCSCCISPYDPTDYIVDNATNDEFISDEVVSDEAHSQHPMPYCGEWAFIDTSGEIVIPFTKYSRVWNFGEGLAWIRDTKDGKWGVINTKGKLVIPFEFDTTYSFEGFSDGTAIVEKDEKWKLIDKRGEILTNFKHTPSRFCDGLTKVAKTPKYGNTKYGFMNKKGEVVIPIKYDWAWDFNEGLAPVSKNDKHGFINTKGEVVIPLEYDSNWGNGNWAQGAWKPGFSDGFTVISIGNYDDGTERLGVIDTKGNTVIPFEYKAQSLIYAGKEDETAYYWFREGAENCECCENLSHCNKNRKWGILSVSIDDTPYDNDINPNSGVTLSIGIVTASLLAVVASKKKKK